jgi:long-chain acyl-CoA synthetase
VQPAPEDLAVLIYTSGTTGDAKGVELTHANLVSNHYGRRAMFPGLNEQSRTLSLLPWAHAYGLGELHTWVELGGSIGLMGSLDTLLADFALVQPTFMLAVPRAFNRIYSALWSKLNDDGGLKRALFIRSLQAAKRARELAHQGRRSVRNQLMLKLGDALVFSKLRARFGGRLEGVMTGSAAMNPELSQFFFDVGIPLYDVYGMTETSPGITLNCPAAHRAGSVGRPMEGVRVEIDATVVEPGAADGELVVYGPNVMRGYHHRPDATAKVMTADGGLRTGDRGRFDDDGYLFITGRIKDQFKLENGKYVFPAAMEEAMELHPLVQTTMVTGDGRSFCTALVVLDAVAVKAWSGTHHEDLQKTVNEALTASLKGHFASYEIPKKFLFVDEPFTVANGLLTQTMKLKRAKIAERYRPQLEQLHAA